MSYPDITGITSRRINLNITTAKVVNQRRARLGGLWVSAELYRHMLWYVGKRIGEELKGSRQKIVWKVWSCAKWASCSIISVCLASLNNFFIISWWNLWFSQNFKTEWCMDCEVHWLLTLLLQPTDYGHHGEVLWRQVLYSNDWHWLQ